MIVHEELQIAADDEGVEELFVNDRELLDRVVLPRVEDREGESDRFVRAAPGCGVTVRSR